MNNDIKHFEDVSVFPTIPSSRKNQEDKSDRSLVVKSVKYDLLNKARKTVKIGIHIDSLIQPKSASKDAQISL